MTVRDPQVEVAGELLRDSAGSFPVKVERQDILDERLEDPRQMQPPVIVELLVFGGDQRGDKPCRKPIEGDAGAVLIEELIEYLAVAGKDLGRKLRPGVFQLFEGRKAVDDVDGIPREKDDDDGRYDKQHRIAVIRPTP